MGSKSIEKDLENFLIESRIKFENLIQSNEKCKYSKTNWIMMQELQFRIRMDALRNIRVNTLYYGCKTGK